MGISRQDWRRATTALDHATTNRKDSRLPVCLLEIAPEYWTDSREALLLGKGGARRRTPGSYGLNGAGIWMVWRPGRVATKPVGSLRTQFKTRTSSGVLELCPLVSISVPHQSP